MKFIAVFLFVILVSSMAFAQKETAAIEGTVKDNENHPIPAVMITAFSSSLIGQSAVAYTNRSGYYRFLFLTPGNYEVKAELSGFQTVSQKDIHLSLGSTLTVEFTLELARTSETLVVSGAPPLIDMSTPAVPHVIPNELVSNLPRSDRIQNLLALTPGVSDDLVAYGANGTSNQNGTRED